MEIIEGEIQRIEAGKGNVPTKIFVGQESGKAVVVATWEELSAELGAGKYVRLQCDIRMNKGYRNFVLTKILAAGENPKGEPKKVARTIDADEQAKEAQHPKAELMEECLLKSMAMFDKLQKEGGVSFIGYVHPEIAFAQAVSVAQTMFNDCGKDSRTPKY